MRGSLVQRQCNAVPFLLIDRVELLLCRMSMTTISLNKIVGETIKLFSILKICSTLSINMR